MSAFARVTGPLLFLAFGSQWGVLTLRAELMHRIEERLYREGQLTFVSLDRAQERSTLMGVRYYYAYSGRYQNRNFETVEEVPYYYYNLYSEGKNMEARVFLDEKGVAHSHLKDNTLPITKDFATLANFSLYLTLLGLTLSLIGWVTHFAQRLFYATDRTGQV